MRNLLLVISISWAMFLVSPLVCHAEDNTIFIDQAEKAYVYFINVPNEKLEDVKAGIVGKDGVSLVSWESFIDDSDKYMTDNILKNEYKQSRVQAGIIELLEKYPGVPFGLTWNGGVAFTYNDYQHAKRTYETYTDDPEKYEQTRNLDPRADPVKPEWHFGPLLGW